jgi:hypothetical protein
LLRAGGSTCDRRSVIRAPLRRGRRLIAPAATGPLLDARTRPGRCLRGRSRRCIRRSDIALALFGLTAALRCCSLALFSLLLR